MTFLTPFLSFLIIISTSLSVIFIQSIYIITSKKEEVDSLKICKWIIIYNLIILLSIAAVRDFKIYSNIPLKINLQLLLAVPLALITFCLEILPGLINAKIKRYSLNLEVSKVWQGKSIEIMILTVIIAFQEELIFRRIWFEILRDYWKISLVLTVVISSVFFAINHLALGAEIFFQKIIAALVFSLIYIFSKNILLVMLTHALENIFILWRFKET